VNSKVELRLFVRIAAFSSFSVAITINFSVLQMIAPDSSISLSVTAASLVKNCWHGFSKCG